MIPALLWFACAGVFITSANPVETSFDVRWGGETKRMMREAGLRASIDPRTLAKKNEHLPCGCNI